MLRDGRSVGKNLEEMHQYVSAQMIQSSWIVTKDNLLYILWIKKTREDTKPFYRVKLAEKIWKSSAILFSYMLLEVVFVSVFFFERNIMSAYQLWIGYITRHFYFVDQPLFVVWKVTTGIEGITIHYEFKEESPFVYSIKWTKNGKPLCQKDKKYVGGGSKNRFFTIASPTKDDTGNYSCTATNSVGKSSQEVTFGIIWNLIGRGLFFIRHTFYIRKFVKCWQSNRSND